MACSACRLRDVAAGPSLDPVVTAFLEGVVGLVRGLAEAHAEPEQPGPEPHPRPQPQPQPQPGAPRR